MAAGAGSSSSWVGLSFIILGQRLLSILRYFFSFSKKTLAYRRGSVAANQFPPFIFLLLASSTNYNTAGIEPRLQGFLRCKAMLSRYQF
mmetsp:Transcript_21068/g.28958  ORF Transcript_21068/g.28958 Transcript_21068/m.28958 type:complete len:89 (+) Transcript_21068:246-512(+)